MIVTIVGAGTAGWVTAYILSKNNCITKINVIENSKIPIIGTGEGSTYILHPIIQDIGEEHFFNNTSSQYKLGIQYRDWIGKNQNYNAPLDTPIHDYQKDLEVFKEIAVKKEELENYYINANLMGKNIVNKDIFRYSYHFDGFEVGNYFKNILKDNTKIEVFDDEITNIVINEEGITYLESKTSKYTANFYIDCTGFRRLFNDYFKHEWVKASEYLPVDTAIPFQLPSTETYYTVAQAMDAGWMWQIAKKNNTGCGYNFCSKYKTPEQAVEEVNEFLRTKIKPIKIINYNSGFINSPLGSNYCFLGISSNFFEPLEATNIHTTIQMAYWLSDYFDRKIDKEKFNTQTETMLTEFRDFIMFHYRTKRSDTDFWKAEYNRDNIPEKLKHQIEIFQNGGLDCVYDYLNIYWWFPPAYKLGFIKNIFEYKKFETRLDQNAKKHNRKN